MAVLSARLMPMSDAMASEMSRTFIGSSALRRT